MAQTDGTLRGAEFIIEVQREQIRRHQRQIERMIAAAKRIERTLLVTSDFAYHTVDEDLAYLLEPEWPPSQAEQESMRRDIEVMLEKIERVTVSRDWRDREWIIVDKWRWGAAKRVRFHWNGDDDPPVSARLRNVILRWVTGHDSSHRNQTNGPVTSWRQLCAMPYRRLTCTRGFGPKSARELITVLTSANMRPAWADDIERYYR